MSEVPEESLTFNDGTVYSPAHAIEDGDSLYLYFMDTTLTMHDLFLNIEDPANTVKIVGHRYGADTEYNGFTELTSIRKERSIQFSAILKKAE